MAKTPNLDFLSTDLADLIYVSSSSNALCGVFLEAPIPIPCPTSIKFIPDLSNF